jgi:hypothetical protein
MNGGPGKRLAKVALLKLFYQALPNRLYGFVFERNREQISVTIF